MNRHDRLAERHKADVFAMTGTMHPVKIKAPRRVRGKEFVEGYLTTKWLLNTAGTLLGRNR